MRTQPRVFDDELFYYVPGMQFSHDANLKGEVEVSLGTPSGADVDGIHADLDGDGATDLTVHSADFVAGTGGVGYESDAVYGQNVQVQASADGGNEMAVSVYGRDYLNQPMMETITIGDTVTTAVAGLKIFKRVLKIVLPTPGSLANVIDVGWGAKLGLPYKFGVFNWAKEDGTAVYEAAGTANVTVPVTTDPATATTGDPRGAYTPDSAADGAKEYILSYFADNEVNDDGNGGLHGIKHYAG